MGKRVMRYRRRRFRYRGLVCLLVLLALVTTVAYVVFRPDPGDNTDNAQDAGAIGKGEGPGAPQEAEDSSGDVRMPEIGPDDDGTQTGATDPNTSSDGEEADGPYTLGTALSEGETVDDSWFEDAVFLGDSRTEGLQLYSGITTGTFFWEWGMSVFKVDDTGHRKVAVNGENMTLMEALSTGTWNKVYIMLGINDLGYPAQSYQKALAEVVDQVREIQSDAVIYLQTMPPVNESMAQANGIAYYINNENVKAFNEAITQVAQEKQVVLLDTASCLTDSQGQLPADMSSDGVHFKKAGYQTWLEYLKCHTISQEDYQAAREAA